MDSLRPGDPRHIGKYAVSGRLGPAGWARCSWGGLPDGHAVAVKVIHSVLARDEVFRRHFRQEVELGHRVGGRHAAQVIDADPGADRPWMVTNYVAGPSLTQVLAAHPRLPPHTVQFLGAGLADALCAAVHRGRDHPPGPEARERPADRHRAPGHRLRRRQGRRRFLRHRTPRDAGVHRAGDTDQGGYVTWACDVFALGVVLAFGGIRPFGAGTAEAIDYRVVHHEPELRGLDPLIREIVAECLVKDPDKRPMPAAIADRLANGEVTGGWLPEPVQEMITDWAPPREPPMAGPTGLDRARLMAEAEQIAGRSLTPKAPSASSCFTSRRWCSGGPAQAGQLLDDARSAATRAGRPQTLVALVFGRFLIESSPVGVGAVAGCIDPVPADQFLADIAAYRHVLTHRRWGPRGTAEVLAAVAEAAAGASPVRAAPDRRPRRRRVAASHGLGPGSHGGGLPDTDQAEQMIGVLGRARPGGATARARAAGVGLAHAAAGKTAADVSPGPAHVDSDTARYSVALALAETAVAAAGAGRSTQAGSPPTSGHSPHRHEIGDSATDTGPRPPRAGVDPARAARYLAEAGELGASIAPQGSASSAARPTCGRGRSPR